MLFNFKVNNVITILFFVILIFILSPGHSYSQPNNSCINHCSIVEGSNKDDVLFADIDIPTLVQGKKGNDQIQGGQSPDLLKGGDGDDRIQGDLYYSNRIGPDFIAGEDGNDILLGIASSDYIYGGNGDDFIVPGTQGGTINGGKGNDVLYGQSNATTILVGGPGEDIFVCTSGIDIVVDYTSGPSGDILQESGGKCEITDKDELNKESNKNTPEDTIIYKE